MGLVGVDYIGIVHNLVRRQNVFRDQKTNVSNQPVKVKKINYWTFRGSVTLYISFLT
jgi:hypothetical protein